MKLRSLLLVAAYASVSSLLAGDGRLLEIRQIYVLPMTGGLDQYLANRLVESGRFAVVTDPARADAILTDQIGSVFEERYDSMYPPPPPPPAEPSSSSASKTSTSKTESGTTRSGTSSPVEEKSMVALMGAASSGARVSSFSRGRGNVFLVDRDTRQVVWSTFLRPRTTRPDEMDRTADKIVDRIEDAVSRQQKVARKGSKSTEGAAFLPPARPRVPVIAAPVPVNPPPAIPDAVSAEPAASAPVASPTPVAPPAPPAAAPPAR